MVIYTLGILCARCLCSWKLLEKLYDGFIQKGTVATKVEEFQTQSLALIRKVGRGGKKAESGRDQKGENEESCSSNQ